MVHLTTLTFLELRQALFMSSEVYHPRVVKNTMHQLRAPFKRNDVQHTSLKAVKCTMHYSRNLRLVKCTMHYLRVVVSKPAFVYCVFSTIFGFEPSPTVLCDRDPDFIIQSVVGLYLD